MKTIGRRGSSSEYTIFSEGTFLRSFIYKGVVYEHDVLSGRYYRIDEPSGCGSRLWREGGMTRRRISVALFANLFKECEERIAEAEKRGAA